MKRTRARRIAQGGFTLVELMISLLISSLLVAMIISVYTSMSQGYRVQQQVAEVQQVLGAAQDMMTGDLRQAGLGMPQGFTWAGSTTQPLPALDIIDGTANPDQIAVFYADPTAQARIVADYLSPTEFVLPLTTVSVDSTDRFVAGDLAVISLPVIPTTQVAYEAGATRPPEEPTPGDLSQGGKTPVYYACVVQIAAPPSANTLVLSTAAPWGTANNAQCQMVANKFHSATATPILMIYRLTAHAYRIDTTRPTLGVLQMSASGGLVANDWQDLGVGFTDLQLASRWFDSDVGVDNGDADADPRRNWYANAEQHARAVASAPMVAETDPTRAVAALKVSVSLVARTTADVIGGAVTDQTPVLMDAARPNYNEIGNRGAVAATPKRIYRYTTFKVDMRNLGIGR
ncbi:MAG: prepilin-type N-terminal cleavage/methylation domain-containing protein [Deltaproteobacteria bacterium]|nr:prepilin-type N-terminal cleavage/methylation domain-containing protein [Deltaproteobacteria bacterium]